MKTLRLAFAATFAVSLAIGIVPGALHPFSWKIALLDWGVLIALIGPAVGLLAGVRSLRIAFGVVCVLAALMWGAMPFIPTDIDRERSELYIWAYYEALFIVGSIVGLSFSKKEPNKIITDNDGAAPHRV
jgi:hypothetical protein